MVAQYAAGSTTQASSSRILRLLRVLRPREGWLVLALAWMMLMFLPAAASAGNLILGLAPLYWLMTCGLILSWWLAHRPVHGLLAAPLLLLAGIVADLIWGVHVLNIVPLLLQLAGRLIWWLGCGVHPQSATTAPAISYPAQQALALADFWQRLNWWLGGITGGRGVPDNLVLIGMVGLLGWGLAAWAGWWTARHGRPFVAMLPTAVLLAQAVYLMDDGLGYLLAFLACAPMLLAMTRFHYMEQSWSAAGTDYSGELRLETGLIALLAAGLVALVSPTLPFVTSQDFSSLFWRRFEQPYRQVEQRINSSFPGIEGKKSLVPALGVAPGGLPRAHLLGGRPELGREVALRIQVKGVQPEDLLRWRGQTFAIYTGRGWQGDDALQRQGDIAYTSKDLSAGEPWISAQPFSRHPVLSSVSVLAASRAALYSAGEPVSVDQDYQALLRAPGELAALTTRDAASRYTILGAVSDQDAAALRGAGTDYPPYIRQLYLQLPGVVPVEVRARSAELTANAGTPYDAALAIEAYLRSMPYDLNVPTPPLDRELVSWFLTDLKRGYCDYFATAMVVLARASGIPARLAVGYASGTYDPASASYVVTEAQAHSWPEIYFPGYGWVPFEPTPAQPVPGRINMDKPPLQYGSPYGPQNMATGIDEMRLLAEARYTEDTRFIWNRIGVAALNALAFAWMLWVVLRRRSDRLPAGAAAWYEEMSRWGARLGRAPQKTETPREYAEVLTNVVAAESGRAYGWSRREVEQAAGVVRRDAPQLAELYERTRFGPDDGNTRPPTLAQEERWNPLWEALRRLRRAARWKI